MNPSTAATSRRNLLKTTAATAAVASAAQLIVPRSVYAAGSDVIKVGLIGCGGRGSGAAIQALKADKGNRLVALGDAFMDKATGALQRFKGNKDVGTQVTATPETCFDGMDNYKKVTELADVVLLTTPPAFRKIHFKYAIDQGKHIFAEKPLCVDAAGYREMQACVAQAKQKNLAFVDGFCWRYELGHRDTVPRIHGGEIGDVTSIFSYYNAAELWMHARRPEWSDTEWQMRNWLYFTWLSGDHIVEQAVHSIDKVMWFMKDVPPVRAWGTGGRQARTDPSFGHIWDHFAIVYEWADGTRAHVYCRQQNKVATGVKDHVIGTRGWCDITSGSSYVIKLRGKEEPAWKYTGPKNEMYQQEHDELFASIRAGKPINAGERVANSAMAAILGRNAAYTGKIITWDEATKAAEDLFPKNLDIKGTLATPPVPVPGKVTL